MSLQDKETAHLKIDPDKYRKGYDRIFNNKKRSLEENAEILEIIDGASRNDDLHHVKSKKWLYNRVEELENLLNESQTARFGLTLQVTELRKKLGESFNDCI